jgi:hypothetical protein
MKRDGLRRGIPLLASPILLVARRGLPIGTLASREPTPCKLLRCSARRSLLACREELSKN